MIEQHLGIRFAEPPVGQRRWQPPVFVGDAAPLGTWAPDCPQPPDPGRTRAPGQDEDCLFLNVWAPATPPAEPLPVLVWFYGGSFLFGSASDPACDGAALAARGAVVVTAAYRVGLLGYLAHPALTAESPHGSSGNYGLLDQLAALRWVRERIADFGGDAGRVTAFGVSAGSASLALLQTSPLAKDAFDRLILQSPGSVPPPGHAGRCGVGGARRLRARCRQDAGVVAGRGPAAERGADPEDARADRATPAAADPRRVGGARRRPRRLSRRPLPRRADVGRQQRG